jgi:hypothetical protein
MTPRFARHHSPVGSRGRICPLFFLKPSAFFLRVARLQTVSQEHERRYVGSYAVAEYPVGDRVVDA